LWSVPYFLFKNAAAIEKLTDAQFWDILSSLPQSYRSALANAYENGDATEVGRLTGLVVANFGSLLQGGVIGSIKTVTGFEDAVKATSVAADLRPGWKQSELDVGSELGLGHIAQVSYKDGLVVPNGTLGSVRPAFVATDGTISFEVKNYNIASNSDGLIRNISQQAITRQANLPAGMEQSIVIDVRGQTVTDAQKISIIQGIVQKSNGIISPTAIRFLTR